MTNPNSAVAWSRQRELLEPAAFGGGGPGVPPGSALAGKTGQQLIQRLLVGDLPYPLMVQTMDLALIAIDLALDAFQVAPRLKPDNLMGAVHVGWFAPSIDPAPGWVTSTTSRPEVGHPTAHLSAHTVRAANIDAGPL